MICKKCDCNKSVHDFYKSHDSVCKKCYIAQRTAYRRKLQEEGTNEVEDLTDIKCCTKCNENKMLSEFDHRINKKSHYRRAQCKECRRAKHKTIYKAKREKILQQQQLNMMKSSEN